MGCLGTAQCTCGCCAGIAQETPAPVVNRAGLSEIAYRVGDYGRFLASMQARLSSSDYPALARLSSRQSDDFSMALLDSAAVMFDVLTFYQERLANESYLRTAQQRRSVLELGALVGYRLNPGVAAQARLAFSLKPQAAAIVIPSGTQVQSVPGPGQKAQTFETIADLAARPEWSALAAQTSQGWQPARGDTSLYLAGISTQVNPGDVILIVGAERIGHPNNENWDARVVTTVAADPVNARTFIAWNEGLGAPSGTVGPTQHDPKCFVFRQRAALFGYNAVDPNLLATTDAAGKPTPITHQLVSDGSTPPVWTWANFKLGSTIDLDSAYPKVTQGSWVLLENAETFSASRSLQGRVMLYFAQAVAQVARSNFGLSAKITSVAPDTTAFFSDFVLPSTAAFAQSELLAVAPQPLFYPLYGASLAFQTRVDGLAPGQALAIQGQRQKIRIRAGVTGVQLVTDTGAVRTLAPYDILTVAAPVDYLDAGTPAALDPAGFGAALTPGAASLALIVEAEDRDGTRGVLTDSGTSAPSVSSASLERVPADKKDPMVQEIALIATGAAAVTTDRDRTTVALARNLGYCYDRATVTVNANVAMATQGASTTAILGSGSASTPNQRFTLASSPLTYVSASTPSGAVSTLQVRVDDLLWTPVASLYGAAPTARAYSAPVNDDGSTTVVFGDGVEGARLPSGQNNVRASFRVGLGVAGNVAAGAISNLIDRPLGVTGVTNPEAASGGQDPQSIADARQNVPLAALTLDRAVSLLDYRNYAASFAGVAKALASWTPNGPGKGIAITIAGVNGATVDPDSDTYGHLLQSLRTYGDPFVPITLSSYAPATFTMRIALKIAADADAAAVQAAVEAALRSRYSFANRSFGQPVSIDEIDALVQPIPGVVALEVRQLRRLGAATGWLPRLQFGRPFQITADADEILTLDPAPLAFGALP